jgi:photosystem II stability/assembly factor-like uncharacterized protein
MMKTYAVLACIVLMMSPPSYGGYRISVSKTYSLPSGGWKRVQCLSGDRCVLSSDFAVWLSSVNADGFRPIYVTDKKHFEMIYSVYFDNSKDGVCLTTKGLFITHSSGSIWKPYKLPKRNGELLFTSAWMRPDQSIIVVGQRYVPIASGDDLPNYLLNQNEKGDLLGAKPAIYQTNDQGNTWQRSDVGDPMMGFVQAIVYFSDLHGVAQGANGIFVTTDGGHRWSFEQPAELHERQLFGSEPPVALNCQAVQVLSSKSIITIFTDGLRSALLRSTDGGHHWKVYAILPFRAIRLQFLTGTVGLLQDIYGGMWKTFDGGRTWRKDESLGYPITLHRSNSGSVWLLYPGKLVRAEVILRP